MIILILIFILIAPEGVSLTEANNILRSSKKGKLPVVNSQGQLVALMSRTGLLFNFLFLLIYFIITNILKLDLMKRMEFPDASVDNNKRLLCGASIGTRPNDKDRAKVISFSYL